MLVETSQNKEAEIFSSAAKSRASEKNDAEVMAKSDEVGRRKTAEWEAMLEAEEEARENAESEKKAEVQEIARGRKEAETRNQIGDEAKSDTWVEAEDFLK